MSCYVPQLHLWQGRSSGAAENISKVTKQSKHKVPYDRCCLQKKKIPGQKGGGGVARSAHPQICPWFTVLVSDAFHDDWFSDKGLSSLLKTQVDLELLHLKLGSTHVNLTDKCLSTLHSPKLTYVKLEALDQVTNSGIITLAKNCPNICELMVPRCSLLTDGCFQTVPTLLKGKLVSQLCFLKCSIKRGGIKKFHDPLFAMYMYFWGVRNMKWLFSSSWNIIC